MGGRVGRGVPQPLVPGPLWVPQSLVQGPFQWMGGGGGGTPDRTRTGVPPACPHSGPGQGSPLPIHCPRPRAAHATDRIRCGRYASCGHAGGLSCYVLFSENFWNLSFVEVNLLILTSRLNANLLFLKSFPVQGKFRQ